MEKTRATGYLRHAVSFQVLKIGWSWRKPHRRSVTIRDNFGHITVLAERDTYKLNIEIEVD